MFGYAVNFSLNTPHNLLILECLLTMNGLKLVRLEPALYRRLALDDDHRPRAILPTSQLLSRLFKSSVVLCCVSPIMNNLPTCRLYKAVLTMVPVSMAIFMLAGGHYSNRNNCFYCDSYNRWTSWGRATATFLFSTLMMGTVATRIVFIFVFPRTMNNI